jgi:LysR family transcriptional regulator, chromosome initiation inhibitor
MLDYSAIAAVATVAREGSFERAARALHVTPSAVSQRVKQLEERLGRILIKRGQPCVATEAGRLLCRHAEQVGWLEDDLRQLLPKLDSATAAEPTTTLRIAVNADSLGTWFIPALAEFARTDDALFDVVVDDQDHTVEWLRSAEVWAAVTAVSQPVQGCRSMHLGDLVDTATASPEIVRRYFPDGVTAKALARAPCLTFNRKDRLQEQWMRRAVRKEVSPPTHWLPSSQAFIDATVAGLGWATNPVMMAKPYLQAGTLVELSPRRPLPVPLYWQCARSVAPRLGKLTEKIASVAQKALSQQEK